VCDDYRLNFRLTLEKGTLQLDWELDVKSEGLADYCQVSGSAAAAPKKL
jgi:hypothetical protein